MLELAIFFIILLVSIAICYLVLKDRFRSKLEEWKATELKQLRSEIENQIMDRCKLDLDQWRLAEEKKIRSDSLGKSRVVLKGKIGEQLAPLCPQFKYNLSDARFIGHPVDYIVFDGYSEVKDGGGNIRKIVFLEVKTGRAKLSRNEMKIKDAINSGAVEFETITLSEDESTHILHENRNL